MAMKRPFHPDYRPGEQQRALFPPLSGNTVNGLGESQRRRPTPLYWFDPDTIPHGPLQKYFYENAERLSADREESTRDESKRGPKELDPVAARRVEDSAENWARRVREFALAHEADLAGIALVRDEWIFEGHEVPERWMIVLGFAMDQKELAKGPPRLGELSSADEVSRQYNRAARASKALANFIRGQGWHAVARTGPWAGDIQMIPGAIAAGLGQLGKHGSVINDVYGASFRLGAVTTDLPLVADAPRDIGVDDFCAQCQVCTRLCPPDAIFEDKQLVRGEHKWYVNFDKCIPYFNDTLGCGICIAECPWSRPGVAPGLMQKMLRRRERKSAE
jgi:Pyruvate/2-oxoacid:ferredoxin oxidoreductase delta subunit